MMKERIEEEKDKEECDERYVAYKENVVKAILHQQVTDENCVEFWESQKVSALDFARS